MKILERLIQKVHPGKWEALNELDKKYDAREKKHGFPTKRRFRYISGSHDNDTLIIEREWESMAAMEAAFEKSFTDPELQKLWEEGADIIESSRWEYLFVLE